MSLLIGLATVCGGLLYFYGVCIMLNVRQRVIEDDGWESLLAFGACFAWPIELGFWLAVGGVLLAHGSAARPLAADVRDVVEDLH